MWAVVFWCIWWAAVRRPVSWIRCCLRVSDYYSLRLNNAVEVFLKLINPILIVFMGVIILSVVAAVMLPIMDMNNMI